MSTGRSNQEDKMDWAYREHADDEKWKQNFSRITVWKGSFGIYVRRWEVNVKMNTKATGCVNVDSN
jgi:hypothetical protein